MAWEEALTCISVEAGSDLSASQYRFMTINSSGQLAAATSGGRADGVLQDDPDAAGEVGTLAIAGVTKVEAGAAITRGALVSVGTSGKADVVGSGDTAVGRALAASSADGDIIPVLLKLT